MQLTLKIKLIPSVEQKDSLLRTFTAFNSAANDAAVVGFDGKVFSQPSIHKLCYASIRETYNLTAQLAVRAIGKAVECFKRDKKKCPKFKPRSAIVYDQRIMSFNILQAVGTKSAKRRLKEISRDESNYRRTANHQIARRIVDTAKGTNAAIAIEELKGIRSRTRFRKSPNCA